MNKTQLSCKDLGDSQCDFVATGENDAEVKRKMLEHAGTAHADKAGSAAQKDTLGRRIDEALEDRVSGATEDTSQGGEFLEDDMTDAKAGGGADARNEERGAGRDKSRDEGREGTRDEGRNAAPGERVNVNPNDHSGEAGARAEAEGRRDGNTRTPQGAEEHVAAGAGAREGRDRT